MSAGISKGTSEIAIIGAGAWGTALALAVGRNGSRVRLFARDAEQVAAINATRRNPRAGLESLGDIELPATITASTNWADLARADLCLLVTPAQATRALLPRLGEHLPLTVPLVFCSKGLEAGTGLRQSELARQLLPAQPIGVLSGPSFAADTAAGLPTAVALAAPSMTQAGHYVRLLASPRFRPYALDDVTGVELAGALKNVLALGCGIISGAGLGENARAALIARGLAELTRLGEACGGRASTFSGLAGLGDIVLTCGSTASRNFACGFALGRGKPLAEATAGRTVEGIPTIGAALMLAAGSKVTLPITEALDRLVNRAAPLDSVLEALLARPLTGE